MKTINNVILSIWISTLSHSVFALDAPVALVPGGLNSGDEFYVMFKTSVSSTLTGNLSVADYNTWVNTNADDAHIGSTAGLTWSALMNHEDDMGTITERTLSLFTANTAAPVYTTAGVEIATDSADLFDGSIATAIVFEANGTDNLTAIVWTGSDLAGAANFPLGNNANSTATTGVADNTNSQWIDDTTPEAKTFGNVRIYAVSPLLTVPVIPTAGDDEATVTVNDSVNIAVLTNDSPGNDPIDESTVAVQTDPVNGNITNINTSDGVITYMPNANYIGSDSFTYRVQDDVGASSNIATVSITVTAAPVVPAPTPAPAPTTSGGGGAMGWSLLMVFSVLSLLRAKVRM